MTTKRILLHTNARVNGVLRSPPEGELTVTEGEAKRLVQKEHVAKLAPGETWSKPRAAPKAASDAKPKVTPAAPPPPPAPDTAAAAVDPAAAPTGADQS